RAWWEVAPERIGYSPEDTLTGRGWVHFAKGGSYSPYYADVHLVVNWWGKGAEIKNFYGPNGRLASRPQNEEFYFRPGLTWSGRSQRGLSLRFFPAGAVFVDKVPVAFPYDRELFDGLLGVMNSSLYRELVHAQMAVGSFEVGVIQRTPVPTSQLQALN